MLIDSSVFIAYFYKEDSQHLKAVKLLEDLFYDRHYFFYTDYVFSEVIAILNRKAGYPIAKIVADHLFYNGQCSIIYTDPAIFYKVRNRFCDQKTELSFVDLSLIEIAQERKMDLVTFDQNLESEYKSRVENKV
jgi:predicted nucleic acid-binding protein